MKAFSIILIALMFTFTLCGCPVASRTVAEDTIYSYQRWNEDKRDDLSEMEVKAHKVFFREHIQSAHESAGYEPKEAEDIASKAIGDD